MPDDSQPVQPGTANETSTVKDALGIDRIVAKGDELPDGANAHAAAVTKDPFEGTYARDTLGIVRQVAKGDELPAGWTALAAGEAKKVDAPAENKARTSRSTKS